MSKVVDLTDQRFERLVVIGPADKRYFCKVFCDCGAEKAVRVRDLKRGAVKSCGCLRRQVSAEIAKGRTKHGHARTGIKTPSYNSWRAMKKRCLDPNENRYSKYGGANPPVTICDRWKDSFENFLEDLGERPLGTSLGRFGDSGNYEPGNCAWQTPVEQAANRRPDRKYRNQWTRQNKIKAVHSVVTALPIFATQYLKSYTGQ